MNALTPGSLVHYYDTRSHGILCGVRGADHRSTKHARSVTCQACVGLLGKRPMGDHAGRDAATSGTAP